MYNVIDIYQKIIMEYIISVTAIVLVPFEHNNIELTEKNSKKLIKVKKNNQHYWSFKDYTEFLYHPYHQERQVCNKFWELSKFMRVMKCYIIVVLRLACGLLSERRPYKSGKFS